MKVVVASGNPVKIKACVIAFSKMFPKREWEVVGVSVESGVASQPTSEEETLKGAVNRVNKTFKLVKNADYWVGIEGGLERVGDQLEAFAWVVIKSKDGLLGRGRTGSFFLPKAVVKLIFQGKELGEADDIVFGRTNSKEANGAVGILTGDVMTRTSYYVTAVVLALIPFKNRTLY